MLGENEHEKANEYFSMLVYAVAVLGVVLSLIGFITIRPLASALKAESQMWDVKTKLYGKVFLNSCANGSSLLDAKNTIMLDILPRFYQENCPFALADKKVNAVALPLFLL